MPCGGLVTFSTVDLHTCAHLAQETGDFVTIIDGRRCRVPAHLLPCNVRQDRPAFGGRPRIVTLGDGVAIKPQPGKHLRSRDSVAVITGRAAF